MKNLFLLSSAIFLFSIFSTPHTKAETDSPPSPGEVRIPCIGCSLRGAPLNIALPPMVEIADFFYHLGLPNKKVAESAKLLMNMFDRMNLTTPNANSFIFFLSLFRSLEQMGIKALNQEQLIYLGSKFEKRLPPGDYLNLIKIYEQIKGLTFIRDAQNRFKVILRTVNGRPIQLSGKELPAVENAGREMLEKYVESVQILDGSSMTFNDERSPNQDLKNTKNKKQKLTPEEIEAFTRVSSVDILGFKLIVDAPIIGNIEITPKKIKADIDAPRIPAQVDVTFKKLIWYTHTFDFLD